MPFFNYVENNTYYWCHWRGLFFIIRFIPWLRAFIEAPGPIKMQWVFSWLNNYWCNLLER